jgi:hypothetical protein
MSKELWRSGKPYLSDGETTSWIKITNLRYQPVVEVPFSVERHFVGMQIQWVTRAIPPIRDFCHRLLRAIPRSARANCDLAGTRGRRTGGGRRCQFLGSDRRTGSMTEGAI